MVSVASLASGLATLLLSQLTYSDRLPLSIWTIDLLASLLLIPLVYERTSKTSSQRPQLISLLPFIIFFAVGLGLVWKALLYPMTWDDLHLIRFFSADSLLGTWAGNWEPDNIETPGYRPLSTAFNHFRYVLFHESMALHRVFLVSLYAAFLARVVAIAQKLGMAWQFGVFAGLLSFAARHNIYHYVWLTDGNRLIQGLFAAHAFFMLMQAIEKRENVQFLYAIFFAVAALLVREDSLVLVPLGLLLTLVYLHYTDASARRRRHAYVFCLALVLAAAGFYLLRSQLVKVDSMELDLTGLLKVANLTLFGFIGQQAFDSLSALFVSAWPFFLAVCIFLFIKLLYDRSGWRGPLLWLVAAGAGCLVGLVHDRANLLLFSITLLSFFFAALFAAYSVKGRTWQAVMAVLGVTLLFGAIHSSQTAVEAFHPSAANVVYWNTEFTYGRFASASIPEERIMALRQHLAFFDIYAADIPVSYQASYTDAENSDTFSRMVRQALEQGDRRPAQDNRLFVPLLEPFTP